MAASLLTGCGSSADTSTDTTPATEAATEGATEAATTETASNSDTPLVIAHDDVSEKFSPFFVESVPDQNIVDVTQISLVYNDRSGEFTRCDSPGSGALGLDAGGTDGKDHPRHAQL